ncbi:ATPase family associated with various cellular activities (AAA) [Neorhodopirellula lusitana]|uniref:ATPase family associated with various cellular activities (AAA) n=1 Tax=Neorhodopirellula lusitana TaxID=445327 RepID=A0ABY1QQ08_9BACT|nr:ATP-binding protein [Neorhodopirellula lusitana]SMP77074.1 ATPase family associated with various cellular activities (AAA) [Neorhodopirellula lusitana]
MPSISDTQNIEIWEKAKTVFLPFTPIKLVELFQGRKSEIQRVTDSLNTPGRHVVLFGDRGVGKTSLANLTSFYANWDDGDIFEHSCLSTDSFRTIFDSVFGETGKGLLCRESFVEQVAKCGSSNFSLVKGKRDRLEPVAEFQVDPTSVFETLQDLKVLIILDEFDRVTSDDAKLAIAEMVKKLSDTEADSKLLIVGVARTIVDLIGMHPSAVRAFEQVEMARMEEKEIEEILLSGFKRVGIRIPILLVEKVASLADGYPHFAHLLGLKLVEAALNRLMNKESQDLTVTREDYGPAIAAAILGSMYSLKDAYIRGTETPGVKTQMYRLVLEGIAIQSDVEVPLQRILDYINELGRTKEIKAQNISTHLGMLVNPEKRNVLERPRTGFYRFQDPMLRAYVRMQIAEMKLAETPQYRQMEFKFT